MLHAKFNSKLYLLYAFSVVDKYLPSLVIQTYLKLDTGQTRSRVTKYFSAKPLKY